MRLRGVLIIFILFAWAIEGQSAESRSKRTAHIGRVQRPASRVTGETPNAANAVQATSEHTRAGLGCRLKLYWEHSFSR